MMKTGLLSILLAAVSPIRVNLESHDQIEVAKSQSTFNLAKTRAALEDQYNVDPKDIISWEFYDRNASAADTRMLWNTVRRAKRQPANITTIDWKVVPDDILQKMIQTGYMPHKGISKKVFGTGPWLPKHFSELAQKYMPNGTEIHYIMQASKEMDENVAFLSKKLEEIGIPGAEKAFHMLRPHSYKSDLWRFMNLWYYGGVYMDAKLGFDMPVENWIDFKNDEFLYCPDQLSTVNCPMIVMTQYHPLGALAAKLIIERVENRTYYDDPWKLTGPGVYRDISNGTGMLTQYNTRCWSKFQSPDAYMITDKEDIINNDQNTTYRITKVNPYGEDIHSLMNKCKVCNDYRKLNKNRETYCDQPGTPCEGKDFSQWQDENSKNHHKTGGAINFVDEQKYNTAFYANMTLVDQHWNLTVEQKKDFDNFDKALKHINGK